MRRVKNILLVLLMLLLVTAGAWLGTVFEKQQNAQAEAYIDSIETTVAVVNLDVGAMVDGKLVNYASSVIETMGSGYNLVSASAADKGMQEGTYGARIEFQSDFSENIISINDKNPRQAVIQMSINSRLPEEKYIMLHDQLAEFQQQINGTFASSYVETVFIELHSAQDEIQILLDNDAEDMNSVEQIQLDNYAERINLGELPMINMDIASPDYAMYLSNAQAVVNEINTVYIDSYKKAQEDFSKLQEDVVEQGNDLTEKNGLWIKDVESWADEQSAYVQQVHSYKLELDQWSEESSDYITNANSFLSTADAVDTYLKSELVVLNQQQTKLNEWRMGSSSSLNTLQSKTGNVSSDAQELRDKIDSIKTQIDATDYAELIGLLDQMDSEVSAMETEIQSTLDSIPDTVTILESMPDYTALVAPAKLEKTPIYDQDSPTTPLPAQSQELMSSLTALKEMYTKYNPMEYMNAETTALAAAEMDTFRDNISELQTAVTTANASNMEHMIETYQSYNGYVTDLREEVVDVHDREQENLATSIQGLASTLIRTSNENHEIMDSFVARMPNSRVRTSVNQDVVTNTVQPITYTYKYERDKNELDTINVENPLELTMVILIVLSAGILISAWLINKKDRSTGRVMKQTNAKKKVL